MTIKYIVAEGQIFQQGWDAKLPVLLINHRRIAGLLSDLTDHVRNNPFPFWKWVFSFQDQDFFGKGGKNGRRIDETCGS